MSEINSLLYNSAFMELLWRGQSFKLNHSIWLQKKETALRRRNTGSLFCMENVIAQKFETIQDISRSRVFNTTLFFSRPQIKYTVLDEKKAYCKQEKEHYWTKCFNRDIDPILWSHIGLFWDYWHFVQPSRQQVGWAESLKELLIVWRHTKPPPPLRFIFNKTCMGP